MWKKEKKREGGVWCRTVPPELEKFKRPASPSSVIADK